jgi:hypothetical protein
VWTGAIAIGIADPEEIARAGKCAEIWRSGDLVILDLAMWRSDDLKMYLAIFGGAAVDRHIDQHITRSQIATPHRQITRSANRQIQESM